MRTKPVAVLCFVFLFLLSPQSFAAGNSLASPTLERMAEVGRLWGTVRYLHPYLLDREIDWDAALVAALPRVAAVKSREEYAAAVQGMLDALGDPVTRVLPPEGESAAPAPQPQAAAQAGPALTRRLEDGTLVVDLGHAVQGMGFQDLLRSINAAFRDLSKEPALIIDLRGGPGAGGVAGETFTYVMGEIGDALVSRPCRAPGQRFVQRSGYQPQQGSTSGGYYAGFVTPAAQSFAPDPKAPAAAKRVVFLMNRWSTLPPLAFALQANGDARIVAEGKIGDEALVATRMVPLEGGLSVQVRVSEILPMAGWPGVHADVELPELPAGGRPDAALTAAAVELKKDGWGKAAGSATGSTGTAPLPDAVFRPDKTYPEMLAPDLAHRRLAVIRAWNVIHFFYPYLDLIGDWDAVLPEFLVKMEKAESARDYALTVLEMMTHVPDGHTYVYGHPEMVNVIGGVSLPLVVRWIEGAAVVVTVDGDEAKAAGIQPGDAILAVDGEPVPARIERMSRYLTASTPAGLKNKICSIYLLRGPAGPAVLSFQGAEGKTREVRLTRDPKARFQPAPVGDTVRILPGNFGYVDMKRLTVPEVDGMFERLKGTRGLIFDMRGYPQGTAWSIAPRINTKGAKVGAQFRRAQVSALSEEEGSAGLYFSQPLPPLRGKELYTAPTVMLIDDRAISQSEHTGLFFEAASGTKFIGTATAGANGDVTSFTLPGGISVGFTGHDVRHADGRQLQRVGLTPDIEVAPTRAGLRAGKDEVLERAVRYLEERLK
jgi:C-terminal processing protease CtpA/Prc